MATTAVESTINLLCERFPKAFARFEQRRQPLKVGIHLDLAVLGLPEKDLARALRIYVCNRVYRDRLRVGATRIDLNGEPAGVVTPEQVPTPKDGVAAKSHRRRTRSQSSPARKHAVGAKPHSNPAVGNPSISPKPQVTPMVSPVAAVKRMSLADLRAAAQQRKAGNTG